MGFRQPSAVKPENVVIVIVILELPLLRWPARTTRIFGLHLFTVLRYDEWQISVVFETDRNFQGPKILQAARSE